jgi:hypothetical protein
MTMNARRRTRHRDHDSSKRRKRRKSRRWLAIALAIVVAAITLLWLFPVIVAHTSLRQKILSAALSDFEGSVTVGSASLGWMSPLAASDIEARDRHGQTLVHVRSLGSEKSLLGLLADRSRPGRFRVEEPVVHVVLREDGSNWQDALAGYLSAPAGDAAVDDLTVQVIGGEVAIRDRTTGHELQIAQMDAALQIAQDQAVPIRLRAEGSVTSAGQTPGNLSVELAWQPSEAAAGGPGEGQLTVHGKALPLGALVSAATRGSGAVHAEGTAGCDAVCQWSEHTGSHRIQVNNLVGENVSLRIPHWLGDDRLTSAQVSGSVHLEGDRERWRVEQFALETDFASFEARGSLKTADIASPGVWTNLAGRMSDNDLHIQGHIDLAQLTQMLPATLSARPATRLSSGMAAFSVESLARSSGGLAARLEMTGLAAAHGSRKLDPILLTASVRSTPAGPVIDQAVCQSSFLELTAQGSLQEGSIVIQRGDLAQLAAEVSHFVDLGDCTLTGRLEGDVRWQRSNAAEVTADGSLALRDFELVVSDDDRWTEEQLTVDLAGKAEVREGRVDQVTSGTLAMNSGNDRLLATLTAPVNRPTAGTAWPLRVKGSGQLATWMPRLRSILPTGRWQLAGAVDLDAVASVSPNAIDAQSIQLQLADFQARDRDFVIEEPTIRVEAGGRWDAQQRRVLAREATLTSSTIAFRAEQVVAQLPPAPLAVSGSLSYRGDVNRLSRLWQAPASSLRNPLTGTVTGVVKATHQTGVTQVDWTGEAKDLAYASKSAVATGGSVVNASYSSAPREVWREPVVKLAGRHRYDRQHDTLEIEEFSILADSLQLMTRGRFEDMGGRCIADLSGVIDCELAELSRKLSPLLGPDVWMTGREKSQFVIRGPLVRTPASASAADGQQPVPRTPTVTLTSVSSRGGDGLVSTELAGSAKLGWQSAEVHGLSIGRGELSMSLDEAVVRFAPLQVPVSEGRFLAQPLIDLRSRPATLQAGKGPLIENVRISPQMCQTWLKYVAPLLADATRAEGRFSIALDSARVPLTDRTQSDIHGQLTIHSAQVGPGPLAQQFIAIAQQVKSLIDGRPVASGGTAGSTWLVVPQQSLRFDVNDGRVEHNSLLVNVGDVQVRTSGSVGLDESLALVAEVPIRDTWVAGKPYLSALAGTTIKVPVKGTLSKPRVDNRALRDLSRQAIRGAAGRLLEDELNRGLQQLFGP